MRIGIDCRMYGSAYGYMWSYIENFVSYIANNQDENEYILFFNEREFAEFTTKSSNIHVMKIAAKTGSFAEQFLFPFELQKAKLELMLFSESNIPFFYFGKTVIIIPDLIPYFYPEKHLKGSWMRLLNTFLLKQSIRKSQAIITFSTILARDIIEIFDTHEDKIHIIPPICLAPLETKIVDISEVKKFLSQENIYEKYMLSVGELREYKNIPRLLHAYNLLLKEKKVDFDLVLVGKEDPSYHEIRSTIIKLDLQSRVHIYNILDDTKIRILYQNASLYICPSLYEGSEQTILSALSYNLPIVSSSLPSITAILDKTDGIFFRPMSIPDIQEALKKPLKKTQKYNMKNYSVPIVSQKILDVFNLFSTKK